MSRFNLRVFDFLSPFLFHHKNLSLYLLYHKGFDNQIIWYHHKFFLYHQVYFNSIKFSFSSQFFWHHNYLFITNFSITKNLILFIQKLFILRFFFFFLSLYFITKLVSSQNMNGGKLFKNWGQQKHFIANIPGFHHFKNQMSGRFSKKWETKKNGFAININFLLFRGILQRLITSFFGLDNKTKKKQKNKTFKTKRICKCNHYLTLNCTIE